jgi:rhomboid-like protein
MLQKSSITRNAILPSLGSSGAVYATLVSTAFAFPDTQVKLIFPPTPPASIQTGVGALVAMDVIGALRGWRLFDHWAHLGGAAFGALYWRYGAYIWDNLRVSTNSSK